MADSGIPLDEFSECDIPFVLHVPSLNGYNPVFL